MKNVLLAVPLVAAGVLAAGCAASPTSSAASPASPTSAGTASPAASYIVDAGVIPRSECEPVAVRGLRVYPPGERAALFIPLSGAGGYGECSLVTKQPTLIVGYVQAGVQPGGGGQG